MGVRLFLICIFLLGAFIGIYAEDDEIGNRIIIS